MKRTARPEFLGGAPATTTTVIPTEERFTQMQRLEALGALAAGVAHDFNNILCVILGCSETLAASLAPKDPMHEDLEEIQAAAARATALTQQLLAFSRQQVIEPQIIDVSSVISDVVKMLRRLMGADVELNVVSGAELGTVLADPGQIE
jgi:two-component system, cell cycle sensor histidine kinase and response regulator CckA